MNIKELEKTFRPEWYLDENAFSSSGILHLYWVMVRCEDVQDQRVGVVLERGGFAVYIPIHELPVLSDVLGGVVLRSDLQ